MSNTLVTGQSASSVFLLSGAITTTIKTSILTTGVDSVPTGIDFDGTNCPMTGQQNNKVYLMSGKITGTVKTSMSLAAYPKGSSWDGANTGTARTGAPSKFYYWSGQFTTTIKTSGAAGSINSPADIVLTVDTNYMSTEGTAPGKTMLISGVFTTTVKASIATAYGGKYPDGCGGMEQTPTSMDSTTLLLRKPLNILVSVYPRLSSRV